MIKGKGKIKHFVGKDVSQLNKNKVVVPLFKRKKIRSTEKFIKEIEQEIERYKNRKK